MTKIKYLDLYYQWMETGVLPGNGLCNTFGDYGEGIVDEVFSLFIPQSPDELGDFSNSWNPRMSRPIGLWALGEDNRHIWSFDLRARKFTPLRQNIVLLMAALNGEFDVHQEEAQ